MLQTCRMKGMTFRLFLYYTGGREEIRLHTRWQTARVDGMHSLTELLCQL